MGEERRRGLSVKEQKEMYDTVKELKTHLIGINGSPGKLQEFENNDITLFKKVDSLSKRMAWIGGGIAVLAVIAPYVLEKVFH